MPNVTERETLLLTYMSQGLTSKQIAHKMELCHRTVEKYQSSLRNKLKARNKAHAVYIAMAHGLIATNKKQT